MSLESKLAKSLEGKASYIETGKSDALEAIENFERYHFKSPLNAERIRLGFPVTTKEEIALKAKTERKVGPIIPDYSRKI